MKDKQCLGGGLPVSRDASKQEQAVLPRGIYSCCSDWERSCLLGGVAPGSASDHRQAKLWGPPAGAGVLRCRSP